MFPVLSANGPSGYNLTKSIRIRGSASAYLNRTISSNGSATTWTYSTWMKRGTLGTAQDGFIEARVDGSNNTEIAFTSSDTLSILAFNGGSTVFNLATTQVFRDSSAWYHFIIAVDTTQATSSNRVKLYVNGTQVTAFSTSTYPSQNATTYMSQTSATHNIGRWPSPTQYFDGYLAETIFVDGQQLTPSSFGENNATTGVWQPKAYTGTYGTNGFYLPFTDTSSASPTGLGKDFSGASSNVIVGSATNASTTLTVVSTTGISVGNIVTGTGIPNNTYVTAIGVLQVTLSQAATSTTVSNNYTFSGNNWTCNNISLTAGSTYDSMTDVPTLTSATTANYCTLNPLQVTAADEGTSSDGNLSWSCAGGATYGKIYSTMAIPSTGKYYWEVTAGATGNLDIGIISASDQTTYYPGYSATGYVYYQNNGNKVNNNTYTAYGASYTTNDVIGVAFDATAGTLTFYKNNTSQGTAFTGLTGTYVATLGNESGSVTTSAKINFGQQPFAYTPPTGYVALNAYNLPTSTIVKGNTVMDATTYTGNGTSQSITNAGGFKPDLVWAKVRSTTSSHTLEDSVRGIGKNLFSNLTNAEYTESAGYSITSFNSNGFSVGLDNAGSGSVNANGLTYVGWQWQAGQGTTSSNTSGSITSTVSVNPTAGFSIVTYTGTGSNATVGHGLGVAPSFIIGKKRSSTGSWQCWHSAFTGTQYITLNLTNGVTTNSTVYNGSPTSTIFNIGTDTDLNASGATNVAYCWTEIAGFSKFGSYTGNGSSDGPFVYCGFRPSYVMVKESSSANSWTIWDKARTPYNQENSSLFADSANAELTNTDLSIDALSNGFKLRGPNANSNQSSQTFIYVAFAENPFKNALAR